MVVELKRGHCTSRSTLDRHGGADIAATARIRNGWMEVPVVIAISHIQSSPATGKRSSVCQLCQKQPDL